MKIDSVSTGLAQPGAKNIEYDRHAPLNLPRAIAMTEPPRADLHDPVYQAFQILRLGFTVAPIIAGTDKFLHLLTNWNMYLAPTIARLIPANVFMSIVGVVEILAGILVAVRPRIGGYVVGFWLLGIVANFMLYPGYFDIALRDFGLALGAFALARLAVRFDRNHKKENHHG